MGAPWDVLGLVATNDLVAIKRAYAGRLKLTRPDDDAEGYQRLREAYELALALARHAASDTAASSNAAGEVDANHEAGDGRTRMMPAIETVTPMLAREDAREQALDRGEHMSAGHPDVAPPADGPIGSPIDAAAVPADQDAPESLSSDWTHPRELAVSLHRYWRENDDAALLAAWPRLREELDMLPLALRDEASVHFAELVLQSADLPIDLLEHLADWFEWDRDFRSLAALGPERAIALHERIDEAGLRADRHGELRARFADLLVLERLLAAGRRLRALVFSVLARPRIERRLDELDGRRARQLRLDADAAVAMRGCERRAWYLRSSLLALLIIAIVQLIGDSASVPLPWAWFTPLFLAVALPQLLDPLAVRFEHLVERWRPAIRGSVVVATGVAMLALWLTSGSPASAPQDDALRVGPLQIAFVAVALAFCVMLWPRQAQWRNLVPLLVVVLGYALSRLSDTLHATLALSLSAAWCGALAILFARRPDRLMPLYRLRSWPHYLPTTALGWLFVLIAIKGILGLAIALPLLLLPLTTYVQAAVFGPRFAIAAPAAAFAIGVLAPPSDAGVLTIAALLGLQLGLAGLQGLASALARRRFVRGQERT